MQMAKVRVAARGRGTLLLAAEAVVTASRGGCAVPETTPVLDLQPGDWLGIDYGLSWAPEPATLPLWRAAAPHGSEKTIKVPEQMTADLAFLLGAYLSEGHTTRSNWSVILTNSVDEVLEQARAAYASVFGLTARITRQPGRCHGLVTSSKQLVEFMEFLGCGSRARDKRVPEVIHRGTREHALRFMQGVALDGYTTNGPAAKWAVCLESREAIDGLQAVLTRLGLVNAQILKFNHEMQKQYFEVYCPGVWGQRAAQQIPFLEPDKASRAAEYSARRFRSDAHDRVPGLAGPDLYRCLPAGTPGRNGRGTGRQAHAHLLDKRTRHVSRRSVRRVRAAGAELPVWLTEILDRPIRFAEVLSVESRPQFY